MPVESLNGTSFTRVVFGDTAVLFSVDTGTTFTSVTYEVPVAVSRQFITGLSPGQSYDVLEEAGSSGNRRITVVPGDGPTADEGGVIRLEERPARRRPVRPR